MSATAFRFARRAATAIIVGSLVLTAASSAIAAPQRAPLAPQVGIAGPSPTLHPSGNDRLIENGGSGTQGKAQSDPDGNYNYGVDQFGHPGGLYLVDQDGNNGCGNDQDFEDDNNGNCGGGRIRTTTCSKVGGAHTHGNAAAHRHMVPVTCPVPPTTTKPVSPTEPAPTTGVVQQLLTDTSALFG